MVGNELAISVSGASKNFGPVRAVDNLSFDVRRGEVFAMLGPNGAGKTTTIRMILDILKPDSGEITVLGHRPGGAILDRIGYLPEERGLYRNQKVAECLTYLGTLKGMSASDAKKKAMHWLERVELEEVATKKVSELSRGMQQKAQLIAAIIHSPELLIVDEPFSGLDPVNTQLVKDILHELKSQGTTIIMSTHMMHQVEAMSDRLVMLNHGRRVLYGTVDEIRRKYAIGAVVVEGDGDWSKLPGVARVTQDENGREFTLVLADGTTPKDLMKAIAESPEHHIRRFEEALPSLDEIFIKVVEGDAGEQEEAGGA